MVRDVREPDRERISQWIRRSVLIGPHGTVTFGEWRSRNFPLSAPCPAPCLCSKLGPYLTEWHDSFCLTTRLRVLWFVQVVALSHSLTSVHQRRVTLNSTTGSTIQSPIHKLEKSLSCEHSLFINKWIHHDDSSTKQIRCCTPFINCWMIHHDDSDMAMKRARLSH